jgi:hypothetical protein
MDHDNLNRAVDQAIERIEKSHLRGEDCAIYAEIDKSNLKSVPTKNETEGAKIPRVFPMSNEVTSTGSTKYQPQSGRSRHFHPASEDPRQFTLLKFYELNAAAVKILLEGKDAASMDLPFTPGPKEHEIIHYQSNPQRSILLMGRRYEIVSPYFRSLIPDLILNLIVTKAGQEKRRALCLECGPSMHRALTGKSPSSGSCS